jgi:hypothetical protein
MATALSKGAAARGKRIAFGDKIKIRWDQHCPPIFQGNPNIAPPGTELSPDIEWIPFYKSNRLYNRQDGNRWVWNYEFHASPGEMFFTEPELRAAKRAGKSFILIEANVPRWKSASVNKDWGHDKYQAVADTLRRQGHEIVQLSYGSAGLSGGKTIKTASFRDALAILRRAALYIGPEGGLHHGAAAVGVPGVVLFGGFIPPSVTGYDSHTNLTGGAEACGSLQRCQHCVDAMARISVDEVLSAANDHLKKEAA